MGELYRLSETSFLLLSLTLSAELITETAVLIYSVRRLHCGQKEWTENVLEAGVLLQMLLLVYLLAEVRFHAEELIVLPSGLVKTRYVVFFFLLAAGSAAAWQLQMIWPLFVPVVSCFTLPVTEHHSAGLFALFYQAEVLFYLIRAGHLYSLRRRERKRQPSANSVKEAIDTLHAGLLFYRQDGSIVLQNSRMQLLMRRLTGMLEASGTDFYEKLRKGEVKPDCVREEKADGILYRLPDGEIWSFDLRELSVKKRPYLLLAASEVTESWNTTRELQIQKQELEEKNREFQELLENLGTVSRLEEVARAKSWLHDIMGQKISLLLRSLQENREPDEESLRRFAQELPQQIRKIPEIRAEQVLRTLVETYERLGVSIQIEGKPASEPEAARVQAEIATEGVTNAVRHGYAVHVAILFSETDENWNMEIENDGIPPDGPVKEGGGLREIRRKVNLLCGCFSYRTVPAFRMTVLLPKGEIK